MIGVLFVLALVGVIGYAGMRLPLYLNYMKVARSMEPRPPSSKANPWIRRRCAARSRSTGRSRTSTASSAKDVEITKDEGGVMHVAYDDSAPTSRTSRCPCTSTRP
jgi:hypothetical protein